jgi:soluble lytic murein transglycosylase-like protein
MAFLIPFIFLTFSLGAEELSFSYVHQNETTGLKSDPAADKIRGESIVYAHYRRYPNSTRGSETWQRCYENSDSYFFCEIILNNRERFSDPGTAKEKRKRFFDTVMSLDNEASRPKQCLQARKVLNELVDDPSAYSLHARSYYWLWSCAKWLNDSEQAAQISLTLSKKFPVSHHTLLILIQEKSPRLDEILSESSDWPIRYRSELVPAINPFIAGIEALMEKKEDGAAAVLGLHINSRLQEAEPELRLYMASLMSRVSASVPSVLPIARVLVPLFQELPEYLSVTLLRLLFPNAYEMPGADQTKQVVFRDLIQQYKLDLDPHLLKGLIHQESALNPRAASHAGAYGLTQMLIGTANDQWRAMSKQSDATVTPTMLFDPAFAVKVGAADFQRRLKTFGGNRILAIASYNAGETGVKNWLKEVKPIRDQQILADVLFMNRMNAETHVPQYVAAVLSKAFWYAQLYPD